ncbi:MAG: DNA-directed RNA polymerase subunit beta' [Parcubacteria group bacterium]|nr:DNA-directed RNA polymerase subunit beta' [Parcubacteria group bacterium]
MSKVPDTRDFNAVLIRLASPDDIREWSFGEVEKAETINYRTGRAERGGLFDERIFGPTKDYECYCGKYRRVRYKNIVCEKCGVEVTRSIVRHERMGHIELAAPVAHIWFVRGIPSRVGLLLDLPLTDVIKVIYFAGYIVVEINEEERSRVRKELTNEYKSKTKATADAEELARLKNLFDATLEEIEELRPGIVLDEVKYYRYSLKYGSVFSAEIGAEAIYKLFKRIDLEKLEKEVEEAREDAPAMERAKLAKRVGLIRQMRRAGVRPEWMFLTTIPVMPPALRPMIALDGGRHATSDINDLYRRVINRNNRLRKLLEVKAPEVILRNEKRILQEAVDSLIDNAMRRGSTQAAGGIGRRELKSLAENLKGKQGLFRQNLLGKRVDYSGRSVIVVGPNLHLDQCGLPKHMALELFRPFVISKILEKELAFNIRGANRLIEEGIPEVWAILEECIKNKYVLLNRAPTLHRLGIQAFQPVLIEGNAIEFHPLVCPAFNADFDGDQVAVHLPLSEKAQEEARELLAADKNILKPGSGDPTVSAKMLDILLGCFWVTKIIPGEKGEGKIFPSPNIAITAYDFGEVSLRARIQVLGTVSEKYKEFEGKLFETTVGRLLFNSILASDYPYVNTQVDRKVLQDIVNAFIETKDLHMTALAMDRIKDFGFKYATKSGITWGVDDIEVPEKKKEIVENSLAKASAVSEHYEEGLLSEDERYRKTIEIWQEARNDIEKLMPDTLDPVGPVYDMLKSGARGQVGQISQMAGMKGLITNTVGKILSFPVISSYKEGLTPVEYFITTHGARYGLTATALQTAKAGYLTRRLVDVAQDSTILEEDCGETEGKKVAVHPPKGGGGIEAPFIKRTIGRILAKDAKDKDGKTVMKKGTLLRKQDIEEIEEKGVEEVFVRSVLTCATLRGFCRNCYGLDLGRNHLVNLGEAVGVVAAQAIGEPGTQLTMRTFHMGGVAGENITMGLPRVEEVFERRTPKALAVLSRTDGTVIDVRKQNAEHVIVVLPDAGSKVKEALEYVAPFGRVPVVKAGDMVVKGQQLSDGSPDLLELFKIGGREKTEEYIIDEIVRIYALQGAPVSYKHVEVIVRQMFSRVKVKNPGDSRRATGDILELAYFTEENERLTKAGKEPMKADSIILGISSVALSSASFLSAASFQNTTRVLIQAALRGARDNLKGLKENVIIGRLIPVGTGFKKGVNQSREDEEIIEIEGGGEE